MLIILWEISSLLFWLSVVFVIVVKLCFDFFDSLSVERFNEKILVVEIKYIFLFLIIILLCNIFELLL